MKRLIVLAAIITVVGGTASWAQTNAFKVSIKGTVTVADGETKNGTKIQVKDVAKGKSGLLSDTNNVLMLIYSSVDNAIEVNEVDPVANSIVRTIFSSFALAALDNGKFNSDLEDFDEFGNGVTFTNNIPAFNGDLQADGKASVKNGQITAIGAKLTGAWKDPRFDPSVEPAAVFKGTLKSFGTNAVPVNCCNTF
jgi:hypothetical protein